MSTATQVIPDHDLRGVLRIPAFRRLWTALSLSSLGDWLGLLALTALAPRLADDGYAAANLAIAGVFILRLAPAILIGPLGGVVADRLDRRWTMVVCDVARFALFLSIPLVGTLWWLFVATLLIEVASLVWIPAKEATLPNLVPRERLETANQLSLFTTYGTAPVAAAVFAGLALLSGMLDNSVPAIDEVELALYVNAATFLVSAATIFRLT
ncbi:MAG TPA: MFS transporter, partial [Nocardioidaceae bacterium]